jgi:hypothetical protein
MGVNSSWVLRSSCYRWRSQSRSKAPAICSSTCSASLAFMRIVGNPSAIDKADIDAQPPFTGSHQLGLLGFCAGDHNEKLAYIYFTERWTDEIARRNPLRDRYVIIFFSAEGKLTRIFSNVPGIDPVFPATEHSWERLMWGEAINTK